MNIILIVRLIEINNILSQTFTNIAKQETHIVIIIITATIITNKRLVTDTLLQVSANIIQAHRQIGQHHDNC